MTAINQTRFSCNSVPRSQFDFMGYSVRNADWRYTAWLPWDGAALRAEWDGEAVEELYAHTGDVGGSFDDYENANEAAANPQVAAALRARLRQFFDRAP
jgi:hypothetical protein